MGMRRRARRRGRRRGLLVGAAAGAAMAHHGSDEEQPPGEAEYVPPPADPADEIEHLAQLHASGALTDEEYATAKANALGS
jgi:hypothetical protein